MCITANFTTPTLCPFAWRVKTVWDAEVYGKFLSLHPIPVPQHQGLQGSGAAEPQSPYWASCIGKWGQIENNYGHIRCRREQQKIFFFCSILKELLLIHQFVGSCKWCWRLWFDDQKGEAVISLRSCSCSVWINKLFFRGYRKLSSWWAPWSCTSSYAFCEMKGWDLSCLNRISWRSLDKSFQKKKKICCLKIYLHILQRTFVFSKKKKKKLERYLLRKEMQVERRNDEVGTGCPSPWTSGISRSSPRCGGFSLEIPPQLYWSLWPLREPLPTFGKGHILFLTFVFGCFPRAGSFQLWGTSMDSDHSLGDVC